MKGMKDGIHRENLQKLATFLAYGELPTEVEFDMSTYCTVIGNGDLDYVTRPPCGTAACALGHAPFAGIRKFKKEDFVDYGRRAFIDDFADSDALDLDQAWHWCFSGGWGEDGTDNTPTGAAKRIQYLLDKGLDKWDGAVDHDAKKLYARTKVKVADPGT